MVASVALTTLTILSDRLMREEWDNTNTIYAAWFVCP